MLYCIAVVGSILIFVIIFCSIKNKVCCGTKDGSKISLEKDIEETIASMPLREEEADLENM
jgi:hypothetical protein